jgi:hypothetical protein
VNSCGETDAKAPPDGQQWRPYADTQRARRKTDDRVERTSGLVGLPESLELSGDWPADAGILHRHTHARRSKAGVKPLGFHEGRHTYANIGIVAGLTPRP